MATTQTIVTNSAWTQVGGAVGPMLITATDDIVIGVGASQPAAGVTGHPLVYNSVPYYIALAGNVWAKAAGSQASVVVTTSTAT